MTHEEMLEVAERLVSMFNDRASGRITGADIETYISRRGRLNGASYEKHPLGIVIYIDFYDHYDNHILRFMYLLYEDYPFFMLQPVLAEIMANLSDPDRLDGVLYNAKQGYLETNAPVALLINRDHCTRFLIAEYVLREIEGFDEADIEMMLQMFALRYDISSFALDMFVNRFYQLGDQVPMDLKQALGQSDMLHRYYVSLIKHVDRFVWPEIVVDALKAILFEIFTQEIPDEDHPIAQWMHSFYYKGGSKRRRLATQLEGLIYGIYPKLVLAIVSKLATFDDRKIFIPLSPQALRGLSEEDIRQAIAEIYGMSLGLGIDWDFIFVVKEDGIFIYRDAIVLIEVVNEVLERPDWHYTQEDLEMVPDLPEILRLMR